ATHETQRSPAARHNVSAGLASPRVPRVGKSLSELGGVQSFPVADEDLAQRLHRSRLDTPRRGDRRGGLACAQQVTCVQRLDLTAPQASGYKAGLLVSLLGER